MTSELAIRFRAFEGNAHMRQMPGHGKTILTVPQVHVLQGQVLGVSHKGVSLRFRMVSPNEVEVNLIPLEGGTVEIRCSVPKEPLKLPQDLQATSPAPATEYGLQRPIDRNPGGSQWAIL